MEREADVFQLIKSMKQLIFKVEEQRNVCNALEMSIANLYKCTQGKMQDDEYYNRFKAFVDIVHESGGILGAHPILVGKWLDVLADQMVALSSGDSEPMTEGDDDDDDESGLASGKMKVVLSDGEVKHFKIKKEVIKTKKDGETTMDVLKEKGFAGLFAMQEEAAFVVDLIDQAFKAAEQSFLAMRFL